MLHQLIYYCIISHEKYKLKKQH